MFDELKGMRAEVDAEILAQLILLEVKRHQLELQGFVIPDPEVWEPEALSEAIVVQVQNRISKAALQKLTDEAQDMGLYE